MKYYYAHLECGRGAEAPTTGIVEADSVLNAMFKATKQEHIPVGDNVEECLEYFSCFEKPDLKEVVVSFEGEEVTFLVSKDQKKLALAIGEYILGTG